MSTQILRRMEKQNQKSVRNVYVIIILSFLDSTKRPVPKLSIFLKKYEAQNYFVLIFFQVEARNIFSVEAEP